MDEQERCEGDDERELLWSYSRLDETCSEVKRPADVAALAELLVEARDAGRRVTFRASGLSFHGQGLNRDMVVSMENFDTIGAIDTDQQTITVGAGVTWGAIVAATKKHNLVPFVIVTSKDITCGGTLASDGISRYSPSFGSESVHVHSFDFLQVGHTEARTILKPDADDVTSEDAILFRAVIGSFGFLGVITSITYGLLNVAKVGGTPHADKRLEVTTRLWAYESFGQLIEKQIQLLEEPIEEDLEKWPFPTEADSEEYPSVYAVAFPGGPNGGRGAVYKSTYSRGDEGGPYIIFRPDWWFRLVIGLALTVPWLKPIINRIVWLTMASDSKNKRVFVNKAEDYMFFMDGDVNTKKHFERPPKKLLAVVQQTFVVHYQKAAEFLDLIPGILEQHDIEPTLFEFLFMPRDRILMSASYETPGFAITLAFQDIKKKKRREAAIAAVRAISKVCHEKFGGRIHLTKNVYAADDVIRDMYGARATEFLGLKEKLDPHGVLRNAFFERVFPET